MRAALLLLLAAAGCAVQPPAAKPDGAQSLAAAETAFAAHSMREDMRSAFIAHFAPDGVFVRSAWVNARSYLADKPAPPIVLDWRPALVAVAASGELGLSTGPWKLTSRTQPDSAPSYGQFVSIWRLESSGPWMVAVDLGISHPEPTLWTSPLEMAAPGRTVSSTARGVDEVEGRFAADAARDGLRAAYARHASARMRLLRENAAPWIGREAVLAAPVTLEAPPAWKIEHGAMARSGDLAYARGTQAAAGRDLPDACFLRVWVVEEGEWRLILDVVTPVRRS